MSIENKTQILFTLLAITKVVYGVVSTSCEPTTFEIPGFRCNICDRLYAKYLISYGKPLEGKELTSVLQCLCNNKEAAKTIEFDIDRLDKLIYGSSLVVTNKYLGISLQNCKQNAVIIKPTIKKRDILVYAIQNISNIVIQNNAIVVETEKSFLLTIQDDGEISFTGKHSVSSNAKHNFLHIGASTVKSIASHAFLFKSLTTTFYFNNLEHILLNSYAIETTGKVSFVLESLGCVHFMPYFMKATLDQLVFIGCYVLLESYSFSDVTFSDEMVILTFSTFGMCGSVTKEAFPSNSLNLKNLNIVNATNNYAACQPEDLKLFLEEAVGSEYCKFLDSINCKSSRMGFQDNLEAMKAKHCSNKNFDAHSFQWPSEVKMLTQDTTSTSTSSTSLSTIATTTTTISTTSFLPTTKTTTTILSTTSLPTTRKPLTVPSASIPKNFESILGLGNADYDEDTTTTTELPKPNMESSAAEYILKAQVLTHIITIMNLLNKFGNIII